MKKIIPFKKDIVFKTNIDEVTSISLEHTLNIDNDNVDGSFIISGEYRVTDKSTTTEPFNIDIPFCISIDDRYDSSKAIVDIDDFYYEIVNNSILSISIDLVLDHLTDKPLILNEREEDKVEELINVEREITNLDNLDDDKSERGSIDNLDKNKKEIETVDDLDDDSRVKISTEVNVKNEIDSIFNHIEDSENFITYSVCIIREGDSLETILDKYSISEEEIRKYNNVSDLKIGDKLIIPSSYEESK